MNILKLNFLPKIQATFTTFLYCATFLHLFIIIGLNFSNFDLANNKQIPNNSIDVILVNNSNKTKPEKAYIAANKSQQGEVTYFKGNNTNNKAAKQSIALKKPIKKDNLNSLAIPKPQSKVDKLLNHIANLKQDAKTFNKGTISAATLEHEDAHYFANWQEYIEKLGNKHYPKQALKNNVTGNLRLLVAINKDGSLKDINLRQSSGYKELDDAAINIVLKAAPFEPLPEKLAQKYEVLEIIRTWQFKGKLLTTN